ncbi:alpha/beta fold hydrolase [Teredinibacter purpureus]|uniref:alpha/beta fold hydrolase n=1 Tax=Teredinibacter purpureus TaxID=2731756 RepID=UPI000698808D|nr:alpha/beta fold hydrolase [Teredinibacter purpureus]
MRMLKRQWVWGVLIGTLGWVNVGLAIDTPIVPDDVEHFWAKNAETSSFVGADDMEIAYVRVVHPASRGVVVLSSGRTESYLKYKDFVGVVYQQGYSFYGIDHRGQGLSGRLLDDRRKGHVRVFANYGADFTQFINTIVVPETPGQHRYLVSHSMGGSIAVLSLASTSPSFNAAVLSSPMMEANLGLPGGCAIAALMSWFCAECSTPREVFATELEAFNHTALTHDKERFFKARALMKAEPQIALSAPTFGWVKQACDSRASQRDAAASIAVPVMLLQSGADTVVHNAAQNQFCALLNKKGETVCVGGAPSVIEGAKHELFFEADIYRDQALRAMFEFWQRYP